MFPIQRYCFRDVVDRVVRDDLLTFSGYTLSNAPFAITVKLSDANRWVNGELIQDCFPYLDKENREILMTGHDNESWAEIFSRIQEEEV